MSGFELSKEEFSAKKKYVPELLDVLKEEVGKVNSGDSDVLMKILKDISASIDQLTKEQGIAESNKKTQEILKNKVTSLEESLKTLKELPELNVSKEMINFSDMLYKQSDEIKQLVSKVTPLDTSFIEKAIVNSLNTFREESAKLSKDNSVILDTISKLVDSMSKQSLNRPTYNKELDNITKAIKESRVTSWEFTVEREKKSERITKVYAKAQL